MEARAEYPGARSLSAAPSPRVIGIDLGTTNSALAWAATRGAIHVFDVPQLIAEGDIGRQAALPSFLYFPGPGEAESGAVRLPWDAAPDAIAGVFARDHGALVPSRQVSSAKSWLSNPSVDRSAPLLPWTNEEGRRISPVEASARLLAHLRDAWNHEHARDDETLRLERQPIVLTVPASFDEEARELTVQAARSAGFDRLTLLEEPLAALYAWIAAHRRDLTTTLGDGALVLVCDVGGGTTDFSLIRTSLNAGRGLETPPLQLEEGESRRSAGAGPGIPRPGLEEGDLAFERIAIGEHLLLGGDNLDLALAVLVEQKLGGGAARLSLTQRHTLRRKCSAAKERLLSEADLEAVRITILGAGRGVVGGGMSADLTRDEVVGALSEGFLPLTRSDDLPARNRRVGLRELGLPYESEPAITKHLAAFLSRARVTASLDGRACPDAVLFNGGFFAPAIARERLLETLTSWCGRRPLVLQNHRLDASVAIGAAFYARLRSVPGASRRLLICAGSARAYYVGVESGAATAAVCVMPRGTQEGTRISLERELTVITNQPAAFTLYSTMTRIDPVDAVVTFAADDDVYRHAPLVTALRYGKRSRRVPLAVRLSVVFTETGTLELWCESTTSEHRWRLSFNLRSAESDPLDDAAADDEGTEEPDQVVIADDALRTAGSLIHAVFGQHGGTLAPGALVGELENALGHGKHAWPLPAIRRMADVLMELPDGRRRGPAYEVRWLNLVGFCTRPGFGTPLDAWRVSELRKVYLAGILFAKDVQSQVEWLVLWQRVAAGFTTGQQRELAQRVIAQLGIGQKRPPRLNAQVDREAWRLLASLERLDAAQRVKLGDELAMRIEREPRNAARLWALGRLGARAPLYGPLNTVVPASTAERWTERLAALKEITPEAAAAIAQLCALTGDAARDVAPDVRRRAIERLAAADFGGDALASLAELVPAGRAAASRMFGEPLPEGLRLDTDDSRRLPPSDAVSASAPDLS